MLFVLSASNTLPEASARSFELRLGRGERKSGNVDAELKLEFFVGAKHSSFVFRSRKHQPLTR